MNGKIGVFPFGEEVRLVEQLHVRKTRRIVVLGVYASAVHATWLDTQGKTRVRALAVASEPCIFWRGEGAEEIIAGISIPPELGSLKPAASNLNGPSGVILDSHFLNALGHDRSDAWLCDLVPHSCVNAGQARAIQREYEPLMQEYGLAEPTVPQVPSRLADDARQRSILNELFQSGADVLIMLGDEPLRWFANPMSGCAKSLKSFGETADTYGRLHDIRIEGKPFNLLPLVHPHQAGRLGAHSAKWASLHEAWMNQSTSLIG